MQFYNKKIIEFYLSFLKIFTVIEFFYYNFK